MRKESQRKKTREATKEGERSVEELKGKPNNLGLREQEINEFDQIEKEAKEAPLQRIHWKEHDKETNAAEAENYQNNQKMKRAALRTCFSATQRGPAPVVHCPNEGFGQINTISKVNETEEIEPEWSKIPVVSKTESEHFKLSDLSSMLVGQCRTQFRNPEGFARALNVIQAATNQSRPLSASTKMQNPKIRRVLFNHPSSGCVNLFSQTGLLKALQSGSLDKTGEIEGAKSTRRKAEKTQKSKGARTERNQTNYSFENCLKILSSTNPNKKGENECFPSQGSPSKRQRRVRDSIVTGNKSKFSSYLDWETQRKSTGMFEDNENEKKRNWLIKRNKSIQGIGVKERLGDHYGLGRVQIKAETRANSNKRERVITSNAQSFQKLRGKAENSFEKLVVFNEK